MIPWPGTKRYGRKSLNERSEVFRVDAGTYETTDSRDDCTKRGNELIVRTRKGVLAFFGGDSTQYAQAGGTRSSERKKPVRKSVAVLKAA